MENNTCRITDHNGNQIYIERQELLKLLGPEIKGLNINVTNTGCITLVNGKTSDARRLLRAVQKAGLRAAPSLVNTL